jgi:hypothetical protein
MIVEYNWRIKDEPVRIVIPNKISRRLLGSKEYKRRIK